MIFDESKRYRAVTTEKSNGKFLALRKIKKCSKIMDQLGRQRNIVGQSAKLQVEQAGLVYNWNLCNRF